VFRCSVHACVERLDQVGMRSSRQHQYRNRCPSIGSKVVDSKLAEDLPIRPRSPLQAGLYSSLKRTSARIPGLIAGKVLLNSTIT
jgi:hypothetical protein